MSRLAIFPDQSERPGGAPLQPHRLHRSRLHPGRTEARGLDFEQANLPEPGAWSGPERHPRAYAEEIGRIQAAEGYSTVDAIRMHPEHPERAMLRDKFLAEHIHTEDEVRFFVEGQVFCLHINAEVMTPL